MQMRLSKWQDQFPCRCYPGTKTRFTNWKHCCLDKQVYWKKILKRIIRKCCKKKRLGAVMIDNIIINTISPVLFAYGNYHGENKYKDKALQWLEETRAEINSVTKGFHQLNIENKNAYDSQSLIQLKNEYCDKKRCLDCSVGYAILKTDNKNL